MYALVTGASSGIGREVAKHLNALGYHLILVARNKEGLQELKKELTGNTLVFAYDLSSTFNCMKLYDKVKKEEIEVLVNCAGSGIYGEFSAVKLDDELDMIDLNIKASHTLTKVFLKDFKERNHGYILNVSSIDAVSYGPYISSYLATKSYMYHLTLGISAELKQEGSHVYVGVLCPSYVESNFSNRSGISSNRKAMLSSFVAKEAVEQMLQRRTVIVPGISNFWYHGFLPRLPKWVQMKWIQKSYKRYEANQIG